MKANVIEAIKSTCLHVAIMMMALTWVSASMAETAAPTRTLHNRTPLANAESCDAVNWNPDLESQFPWIKAGCQEVIDIKGTKWARFNADFVRRNRDGTVVFDFKDRANKTMGRVTLNPGPRQRAMIEGESYSFADLVPGQSLHLYVPEHMYEVATIPGKSQDEFKAIVTPTEKTEVAQVETTPAPAARQLPHTAGPLPLVLLAGLASLLAGIGLTIRRQLAH